MISNLQFYGITAIIGLVISLAFWKEAKIEKWKVRLILLVPTAWALVGAVFIMTIGDRSIDRLNEVLGYFDARNFYTENLRTRSIRVVGVIGIIAVAYFSLVFDLLWGFKNKAYQGTGRNGDKPRTTV